MLSFLECACTNVDPLRYMPSKYTNNIFQRSRCTINVEKLHVFLLIESYRHIIIIQIIHSLELYCIKSHISTDVLTHNCCCMEMVNNGVVSTFKIFMIILFF